MAQASTEACSRTARNTGPFEPQPRLLLCTHSMTSPTGQLRSACTKSEEDTTTQPATPLLQMAMPVRQGSGKRFLPVCGSSYLHCTTFIRAEDGATKLLTCLPNVPPKTYSSVSYKPDFYGGTFPLLLSCCRNQKGEKGKLASFYGLSFVLERTCPHSPIVYINVKLPKLSFSDFFFFDSLGD